MIMFHTPAYAVEQLTEHKFEGYERDCALKYIINDADSSALFIIRQLYKNEFERTKFLYRALRSSKIAQMLLYVHKEKLNDEEREIAYSVILEDPASSYMYYLNSKHFLSEESKKQLLSTMVLDQKTTETFLANAKTFPFSDVGFVIDEIASYNTDIIYRSLLKDSFRKGKARDKAFKIILNDPVQVFTFVSKNDSTQEERQAVYEKHGDYCINLASTNMTYYDTLILFGSFLKRSHQERLVLYLKRELQRKEKDALNNITKALANVNFEESFREDLESILVMHKLAAQ